MAKGDIELSIDANASGAIKGFKQTETAAERAAKGIAKATKEGEAAAKRAAKGINKAAKIAAVGFFAAGAGAFALAKGAAQDQKAAVALATQLKNTTGATKAQVKAVEDWITKQGQLTGITDDELRPALGRLATATGSVHKAQKLALLAQNVSIGTGKEFGTVAQALARAYNGNVGALGRLGIATKDAQGKTKSFAAIQKELADKFKGQSGKQADTLAGKMKILKTDLSEAGETIGYALIPALTNLANFAVKKVIPALTRVGNWMRDNKPIVIALAIAVGTFGAAFIVAATAIKIYEAYTTIAAVATTALSIAKGTMLAVTGAETVAIEGNTVALAAYNAVMAANPIGLAIVAGATLAAGLVVLAHKLRDSADAYKYTLPKAKEYIDTLNGVTAATTRATREMVLERLTKSGLLDQTRALNIADRDAVQAALGNEAARKRVAAALATAVKHGKNYEALQVANHLNIETGAINSSRLEQLKKNEALAATAKQAQRIQDKIDKLAKSNANPQIRIDGADKAIAQLNAVLLLMHDVTSSKGGIQHHKTGGVGSLLTPRVVGATGGIVTRPTLALIGEAGPEAVVPLNRTPGSSPLPTGNGGRGFTIEHVTINAAPNEPINSSLPRAIATLDLLYGAA